MHGIQVSYKVERVVCHEWNPIFLRNLFALLQQRPLEGGNTWFVEPEVPENGNPAEVKVDGHDPVELVV